MMSRHTVSEIVPLSAEETEMGKNALLTLTQNFNLADSCCRLKIDVIVLCGHFYVFFCPGGLPMASVLREAESSHSGFCAPASNGPFGPASVTKPSVTKPPCTQPRGALLGVSL